MLVVLLPVGGQPPGRRQVVELRDGYRHGESVFRNETPRYFERGSLHSQPEDDGRAVSLCASAALPARSSVAKLAKTMQVAVECYGSAEDFLQRIDASRPGCLVLDMVLPGMDGLELQERLITHGCSRPVVFLASIADVPQAVRAMKERTSAAEGAMM